MWNSCDSVWMSSRICAWMVTSSAVVGSSARMSFGSQARAIAIITRWRMPAGELERVVVQAVAGARDADLAEELDDPVRRGLLGQAHVLADRLGDLEPDGQRGVQAGERVLEDEPDLLAAQLAHVVVADLEHVDPVEQDLAGDDPPGRIGHEAGDRQRGHALAAAGLADEAQGLAVAHVEAHVVDGLDDRRRA